MRLLSGSVMTHKDRKVADAWPGAWTGFTLTATRVTSELAGAGCAEILVARAKDLCDFPVLVIYDPPPYATPVPGTEGEYDAPQHVVCLWPADTDPHRFLEVVGPTLDEATAEYGLVHHYLEQTTWEMGLYELAKSADRQSEIHRVNWR